MDGAVFFFSVFFPQQISQLENACTVLLRDYYV